MIRYKNLLLLALGLAAAPLFAQAEYDLKSQEALARESSRSLLSARDQVTAARHAIDSAAAFPNPELEYLGGTARSRVSGGNTGDARSVPTLLGASAERRLRRCVTMSTHKERKSTHARLRPGKKPNRPLGPPPDRSALLIGSLTNQSD